jgi:hypothetical protein
VLIKHLQLSKRAYSSINPFVRNTPAVKLPPNFVQPPPFDEWRKLDHSTVLSRLYLIYESLVHECVAEWLLSLSSLVTYDSLPDKVRATHRDGLGYILQNLGGRRFNNVSVSNLIKEYHESLSGVANHLHTDAFLLHDRNLRLEELQQLVSNCGLDISLGEWLKGHRFFKSADFLDIISHSTIEKAISSLVDLRNEASHATRQLGEIFGEDVLMGYADFISALCGALSEGFTSAALKWHADYGAWTMAGRVNFVVKADNSKCVAPLESCRLRKDAKIYLRGKNFCFDATVLNIRINDNDVSEYTATQPVEFGLHLNVAAVKGSDIFIRTEDLYKNVPTLIQNPGLVDLSVTKTASAEPPLTTTDADAGPAVRAAHEPVVAPIEHSKTQDKPLPSTGLENVSVIKEHGVISTEGTALQPLSLDNPKLLDDEEPEQNDVTEDTETSQDEQ